MAAKSVIWVISVLYCTVCWVYAHVFMLSWTEDSMFYWNEWTGGVSGKLYLLSLSLVLEIIYKWHSHEVEFELWNDAPFCFSCIADALHTSQLYIFTIIVDNVLCFKIILSEWLHFDTVLYRVFPIKTNNRVNKACKVCKRAVLTGGDQLQDLPLRRWQISSLRGSHALQSPLLSSHS